MQCKLFEDEEALDRWVAAQVINAVRAQPELLLCPASGRSPYQMYALLAAQRAVEPDLFSRMRVIEMDEWHGLPRAAPQTSHDYLHRHVLEPLGIPDEHYIGFDPEAEDAEAACRSVQKYLARNGPIDLCVLGMGVNGHLGFIEPADALELHAHVAVLAEASRHHHMLEGLETPPTHGLTLGIADILAARRVLLLVSGPTKQDALARLLTRKVGADLPASFLWLHPGAVCAYDAAADGTA